jgi:dihydroorotate dehydrogenase
MLPYALIRPLLFALDAERAHELTLHALSFTSSLGLTGSTRPSGTPVTAMGLEFPNPVGLAAGLDKNGECIEVWDKLGFGFVEVGTVTPRPQPGNPKPRMFRLPQQQAIINRLGFNNHGVDALLRNVANARYRGILGINIGKNFDTPIERAADDYLDLPRQGICTCQLCNGQHFQSPTPRTSANCRANRNSIRLLRPVEGKRRPHLPTGTGVMYRWC